eukprot:gene9393-1639_t
MRLADADTETRVNHHFDNACVFGGKPTERVSDWFCWWHNRFSKMLLEDLILSSVLAAPGVHHLHSTYTYTTSSCE